MLALVVLAGPPDPPVRLDQWRRRAELIVAADEGARWALCMGLTPHLVVGDMDSLDAAILVSLRSRGVATEVHRQDKDETDAELAVRAALARGATELVILCGLGGRLDHTLANVLLLDAPGLADRATLASGAVEVRLVRSAARFDGAPGDLLSLLPLGEGVIGVSTEGLAYPLVDEPLPAGFARGVSNVFVGQHAAVTLRGGALIAVHTRQTDREKEIRGGT